MKLLLGVLWDIAVDARRHRDEVGFLLLAIATCLVVTALPVNNAWAGGLALVAGFIAAGVQHGTDRGRAWTARVREERDRAEVVEVVGETLEAVGLAGVPVAAHKANRKGWVLELRTPAGRTDVEMLKQADAIAAALGAWRCVSVPGTTHGKPRLLVQGSDPLAVPLVAPWKPAELGCWDAAVPVPVGQDEDGAQVDASVWAQTMLVGGSPGSGKSVFSWLPLLGVALDPTALLVVIDLKPHGIETAPIAARADHGVYDAESALVVLERVWLLIKHRNGVLREDLREKVPTDDRLQFPPVLVVVDEAAELGHSEAGQKALALLQRIVAVGRASGVSVLLCTQKPDSQTIPTNLRDLFAQRVCFRVGNRAQAETVLGVLPDGARPWEIPADQQGTGHMIGTDGRARRFRSVFLDREQVIELASVAARAREVYLDENPDAPAVLPPGEPPQPFLPGLAPGPGEPPKSPPKRRRR